MIEADREERQDSNPVQEAQARRLRGAHAVCLGRHLFKVRADEDECIRARNLRPAAAANARGSDGLTINAWKDTAIVVLSASWLAGAAVL